MTIIATFKDICKTYDGRSLVVRNLDLEVERGEFLTFLGPSGSGKTTLLMMLAGFEAPTSGSIYLEDQLVSLLPPHKRDIGMVFQNYALFPHMSVAENIAFPLQVRKISKAEIVRRTQRILDMVRLPNIAQRRPTELSGGQQQRVALARALVFEPKIVLMDEPLGALDRQLRESMQLEIKRLHERIGVTVIYVTHDQNEALTMSDRIAVFNHGVIEQLAEPKTLYEEPQNSFVASFVGDNNALSCTVTRQQGSTVEAIIPNSGAVVAKIGNVSTLGPAVLCIRPENIRLAQTENDDRNTNVLSASVIETIYFGDHAKLIVRLRGGQTLAVKATTEQAAAISQNVYVFWETKNCMAFEKKGDDGTAQIV